uniref:Uncharacterized protein n=1 Tax=Agrobacterium tumefaciens TaxID=358 RepID=A0A2P0QJW8_AGRTU|nr:hypothetical protein AgrTiChry5_150 [Agrobacterium tumefaciens]
MPQVALRSHLPAAAAPPDWQQQDHPSREDAYNACVDDFRLVNDPVCSRQWDAVAIEQALAPGGISPI